ncbi:3437_t:CDS:2 [Paraglomus brasilianum]|uniref:3436_t:CDS:1 n=1 Tax=Paraglomus brasilianum TaxID=144538 RepID=A0A9N9AF10_9GLOM|nr:3436_t:CDS:2 [Paraglomus brasilianum]CAG8528475.1 3437_t:CDS:2 [Paraglomus brasilianum]
MLQDGTILLYKHYIILFLGSTPPKTVANNLGASNACLTPPVRTNWASGIKSCPNGHPCAA